MGPKTLSKQPAKASSSTSKRTAGPTISKQTEDSDDEGSSSAYSDLEDSEGADSSDSNDLSDTEASEDDYDDSQDEENTKITLTGVEGKDLELRGKDQEAPVESGKRSAWHRQQEDAKEDKQTQVVEDEYAFDSSDEEDVRNTVGNIPLEWYEHYPHIGYDLEGKPILKPPRVSDLDDFLRKMDDPNYWRTVKDKSTGQDVVLTDEDVDLIQRLQKGQFPSSTTDPYEPFEDIFSHETMIHPVTRHPPQKRSFVPSRIEKAMVSKMVHAIKMGWIKPRVKKHDPERFSLLWDKDDSTAGSNERMQRHIPAPKMKLPGHEESYNPPAEYLFTEEEEAKWREQEPEERRINFLPAKYPCLRAVPAYERFIEERFERCLDLYLCPRQRKMRVNVDAEDLIPQLPKPKDLQPFPSIQSIAPLSKAKGGVSRVLFHPLRPFLLVACQRTVRVYHLLKQELAKRLTSNCKWISCMAVHPKGDNVITGSFENRLTWFDMDLSVKPYKTLRHHKGAIREVAFHRKYPLFASASDDGTVIVSHGMVYSDLMQNPLIVPVKVLRGHAISKGMGVLDCAFHPHQPWIVTAGADSTLRLFT
ncbi:block of proliferation protein, putative [Ixodes scapularis]|uniref:Block of proliferation protein, putative n=1 Tax=Ixodes scapularis TaxID=6945 RepID=B7PXW7_IXOSC|nr:block of proliferation protein, putative [Ixodes scapularis]|eukprot:XP_002401969.1 block of proliferation protein, putative [Ixodes scapularis]